MPKFQKVAWHEKKGEGWGTTRYTGLEGSIDGRPVLITKLSHGLRVILMKDHARYNFEHGRFQMVSVPQDFVNKAKRALDADLEFQASEREFNEIMARECMLLP